MPRCTFIGLAALLLKSTTRRNARVKSTLIRETDKHTDRHENRKVTIGPARRAARTQLVKSAI